MLDPEDERLKEKVEVESGPQGLHKTGLG